MRINTGLETCEKCFHRFIVTIELLVSIKCRTMLKAVRID